VGNQEKTDIEIYKMFLLGNQEAFSELVKRYQQKIIYFTLRYVKDIEIAEDLAQDTFVYILVNKKEYDFKYSLKTYLYTIAKCRALNYLKKQKRIVSMQDEYLEVSNGINELEEFILKEEEKRKLMSSVKKLIPQYQSAIYLKDIEGLSYKEIAKILNKNMAQVKVLIHRARKSLEKTMKKEVNIDAK